MKNYEEKFVWKYWLLLYSVARELLHKWISEEMMKTNQIITVFVCSLCRFSA